MIMQMKLWEVPVPVRGCRHRFKYSLFYGNEDGRLILYDNEPGKGDHRHYGEFEEAYPFTSPEMLMTDFINDVKAARRCC